MHNLCIRCSQNRSAQAIQQSLCYVLSPAVSLQNNAMSAYLLPSLSFEAAHLSNIWFLPLTFDAGSLLHQLSVCALLWEFPVMQTPSFPPAVSVPLLFLLLFLCLRKLPRLQTEQA